MRTKIQALITIVNGRDRSAFGKFYLEYEDLLYKIATRYAANSGDAEALLERLFEELWNRPEVLWQTREKHLSVLLVKRMIFLCEERALGRAE
ncbi:DNA-directed RNA polymerase specialized sigma24 family protein [Bacillus tianshenii]|uniref:DNA-directed RNA polymerase specialized sigma24 family protein n=1 Tax=Sutcliffiella tianshenii TaxID=1463404 RepID=A0ABS2NZG9_9BACI|nr:hypothetical protein [Bacillus tianshenii]MBM7620110.1 DNA-directed RNA polymerase specialized sigma24 family protein [Bacillus tianshenii]